MIWRWWIIPPCQFINDTCYKFCWFIVLMSNPIGCRLNVIHEMSDQFNRGGKNDGNRKYQSINLSQHFNKRDPKTAAKSTTGKIYNYVFFFCFHLWITYLFKNVIHENIIHQLFFHKIFQTRYKFGNFRLLYIQIFSL